MWQSPFWSTDSKTQQSKKSLGFQHKVWIESRLQILCHRHHTPALLCGCSCIRFLKSSHFCIQSQPWSCCWPQSGLYSIGNNFHTNHSTIPSNIHLYPTSSMNGWQLWLFQLRCLMIIKKCTIFLLMKIWNSCKMHHTKNLKKSDSLWKRCD